MRGPLSFTVIWLSCGCCQVLRPGGVLECPSSPSVSLSTSCSKLRLGSSPPSLSSCRFLTPFHAVVILSILPKNVDKDDPSYQALQRGYELNRLSWHLRVTLGHGLPQRETKYTSNSIFLEFISCCFPLTSLLAMAPRRMPWNRGLCFAP